MTTGTPHEDTSGQLKGSTEPRVTRPDPEDPPTEPAEELDDTFDPAASPSNLDLVGDGQEESQDRH